MAITTDDFAKIWASTSPLTPYSFSESNYKEGWNFVGATPPSRQMWDFLQKQNDEKTEWLYKAHNDILDLLKTLIPTGCVQAFAGSATPNGWLLCDGSAVSRTDYADLYAVIGDTYGNGDGSTTFNLPNLVDKFIEGSSTAGTEKSAGLPNITGGFVTRGSSSASFPISSSGAFSHSTGSSNVWSMTLQNTNADRMIYEFDASASNSIYGNSTTVQPPALLMQYIIKY